MGDIMKILVQKFGGTSVSTDERRLMAVDKIIYAINKGYSPVVVVSAMGRKGEPYATDTLLSTLNEKFKADNKQAVDLLMSCGEIISAVKMCSELYEKNIRSAALTGGQAGIITDNNYNNASAVAVNTETLMSLIKQNIVPVVAGFQGVTSDGFITTLGRGGSDVTASLLGSALNAHEIQIYTDVDGIMTADPRIVSDASLIKELSYAEVFQFADQGAKVIHPRAVEIAMKANIPLVIKNTLSNCSGTTIGLTGNGNNIITGITHMNNRVQIKIESKLNVENENYSNLFDILAENFISLDLINVFPDEKIFTIDESDLDKFKDIAQNSDLKYSNTENCSKIALIGNGMKGQPGVMAKILKVLTKENIVVMQTADSHSTIWCLIESKFTEKAINALHKAFDLGNTVHTS